jgi:hypothetical protein
MIGLLQGYSRSFQAPNYLTEINHKVAALAK